MANHASAKKRARQNGKRRLVNKTKVSRVRTFTKNLRQAIEKKDKDQAQKLLVTVQSLLDKAAKSPALKKEAAARRTSRLATQVAKL